MIHLVAFSSAVTGATIDGGAPYGCNIIPFSSSVCQFPSPLTPWARHLKTMSDYMEGRAALGLIDPLSSLKDTPVLVFSGSSDFVVLQPVMEAVYSQLLPLVGAAAIQKVFDVPTNHAWVSDIHGNHCSYAGPPFVNKCGYDLAGKSFSHYAKGQPLVPRTRFRASGLSWFRQAPFLPAGDSLRSAQLNQLGLVYTPMGCEKNAECALHVHYHGCGNEPTAYVRLNGIADWAESNSIIVLHPQASGGFFNRTSLPADPSVTADAARGTTALGEAEAEAEDHNGYSYDPEPTGGCWDWTGETGDNFDTQQGPQLRTVMNMLETVRRGAGSAALGLLPSAGSAQGRPEEGRPEVA